MAARRPRPGVERVLPVDRRRDGRRKDWPTTAAATRRHPIVYEDFLPASAAGIFRSNLDRDSRAGDLADDSGYDMEWLAGAIGRDIHDPYALYEALSQEAPA